jgi:hypothetical protein
MLSAAKVVATQARFQLECIDPKERRAERVAVSGETSPVRDCSESAAEQGWLPNPLSAPRNTI